MAGSLDDLAAAVRDALETQIGIPHDPTPDPGQTLLLFNRVGAPISLAELIGSGAPGIESLLAHQVAAALADGMPEGGLVAQGSYLPVGERHLSRWYGVVLKGAKGSAADPSAFNLARMDAQQQFDNNELLLASGAAAGGSPGTVTPAGTVGEYYATGMMPVGWYADDSVWTDYSFSSQDAAPAGPEPPPPPRERLPWTFQLADVTIDPPVIEVPHEQNGAPPVQPDPDPDPGGRFAGRLGALRGGISAARLTTVAETAASPESPVSRALVRDWSVLGVAAGSADAPAGGLERRFDISELTPKHRWLAEKTQLVDVLPEDQASRRDMLVEKLPDILREILGESQEKPPTSTGFAISFQYCVVRFDRPWWDETLLLRSDWGIAGFPQGSIAAGSLDFGAAPVTLITTGMVVVRRLSITASWSGDDEAAISKGISLGPFSIANSDFVQGALTVSGMQPMAWLCQVPPAIPPTTI